jgi:hypothetical protein
MELQYLQNLPKKLRLGKNLSKEGKIFHRIKPYE